MKPENLKTYSFLLILAVISFLFIKVLAPFFDAIVFSTVLVLLFYPVYTYFTSRLKINKNLSALFTLLIIFLVIIIPILLVLGVLSGEAMVFYQNVLNSKDSVINTTNTAIQCVLQSPFFHKYFNMQLDMLIVSINWSQQITMFAQFLTGFIVSNIQAIFSNTVYFMFLLVIMIFIMFYLFIDGDAYIKAIKQILPLSKELSDRLAQRIYQTTRVTLISSLLIGALEGIVGFIIFSLCGVPTPLFWGLIMFVFSLIPAIGANVVWFPIGLFKMLFGPIWQGSAILVSCFIIINALDYFIRPRLIGRNIALPPLVVMLSTLGGLLTMGIPGFILGPVIAALFIVVWDVFGQEYKKQLKEIKKN